jgi:hypothetical protein
MGKDVAPVAFFWKTTGAAAIDEESVKNSNYGRLVFFIYYLKILPAGDLVGESLVIGSGCPVSCRILSNRFFHNTRREMFPYFL